MLLGATNRRDAVDLSILIRIPLQFEVWNPVEQILNILLRSCDLAGDVDLDEVARITEDFTGSDLQELYRCATVFVS